MYQNSPKVFISYSWHPKENKDKVEQLAKRLTDDGIFVQIDIWDLHAGQDKNAYMERMISDKSVDKVLLICNKEYTNKANNRQGGVGIESTIISEEVYSNADQTKFIPIIFEKDENGFEYKPIFIKSRIHYDLSDDITFEKEYEELLRDLYCKPKAQRPALGKMPDYLKDEQPSNLPTAHKVSTIQKSIIKAETNISILIDDYFKSFIEALNEYKIDYTKINNENFISIIENNIKKMQPLKDDFVNFILSICKTKECTGNLFISFFEKWLQFYEDEDISLDVDNSTHGVANDHYRFFNYDVFLSFTTIMMENSRYDILHDVLTSHFYVGKKNNAYKNAIIPYRFMIFQKYNYTLDRYKNERYSLLRVSVTADLISQYSKKIKMSSIVQTDILLYYMSMIYPSETPTNNLWFPRTSCYNQQIEILPKLVSKRYFEEIKVLFGVKTNTELKQLIDNTEEKNIQEIYYIIPKIKEGLIYNKISTLD